MNSRCTIIQASARSHGDTNQISKHINAYYKVKIVDLNPLQIGQYDYDEKNKDDDFIPTISNIIETSDTIVFLTPVYWYTMSGLLKAFLDRFTDLLKSEKSIGRQLRGKNLAYMSVSNEESLSYDFELPVRMSADYLGMNYLGHRHFNVDDGKITDLSLERLNTFMNMI